MLPFRLGSRASLSSWADYKDYINPQFAWTMSWMLNFWKKYILHVIKVDFYHLAWKSYWKGSAVSDVLWLLPASCPQPVAKNTSVSFLKIFGCAWHFGHGGYWWSIFLFYSGTALPVLRIEFDPHTILGPSSRPLGFPNMILLVRLTELIQGLSFER